MYGFFPQTEVLFSLVRLFVKNSLERFGNVLHTPPEGHGLLGVYSLGNEHRRFSQF